MTPEAKEQHDKDFTILNIQLGHLTESINRVEDVLKELRLDFKGQIGELRLEVKEVDEKHTKNYEQVRVSSNNESRTNLKFRTKVTSYATIGSVVGGGLWQLVFFFLNK